MSNKSKGLRLLTIVWVSALFFSFTNLTQGFQVFAQPAVQVLPAAVQDGVILHAFMWKFSDIQANLQAIADAGYNAVQVSPIQGTKTSDPNAEWYFMYQPTNMRVGNAQLGTEDDFVKLCAAARTFGIKIIVDAVLNQVADNGNSGQWDPHLDPVFQNSAYFHNQGSIANYADRRQVTQLNLGNGPDWATQRSDVQGFMLGFLNRAIDDGASGFRFDAAKHIETNGGEDSGQSWAGNFWDPVLSGMHNKANLFLYGEVLPDLGDNDQQYQSYFRITTHGYLWTVSSAIDNQNLSSVLDIFQLNHAVTPNDALVYAENHDTYEHNETKHFSYSKRLISYSIMIARAGMTTLVFDRPGSDDIWKEPDLVAVNQFRNAMSGQPEYLRFPANPVIMIERGNQGMVIVNVSSNNYNLNSPTAIAAGSYTNKGTKPASFTVAGGKITGTVPADSVVTLYNSNVTIPFSPTGLIASTVSSNQINLSWAASAGATSSTSYTIYKSTFSSSGFTSAGTIGSTSFEASGLSSDTTYYFYATATNSAGISPNSSTVSGKTLPPGNFTAVYSSMNLRGSFNNWGSVVMKLIENNIWQATVPLDASTGYAYKYDAFNNWAPETNWGDTNNDGNADTNGSNIAFKPSATGNYQFTFNDKTKAYSVVLTSDVAAAPTFSPAAGGVAAGTVVTIISTTAGSTIYYTTDGTTPTTESPSGPAGSASATVSIPAAVTIKAFAGKSDATGSGVVLAAYTMVSHVPSRFSIIFKSGSNAEYVSFPGDVNNWNLNANVLSLAPNSSSTIVIADGVTAATLARGANLNQLELKLCSYATWDKQWTFNSWTLGSGITLSDSYRQINIACTAGNQVDLIVDVAHTTLSFVEN